ncbi:DUF1963 domain-containing protein [Sphingopyxis granuli]|uniref:DUF1963 domain-containing protein n=1 Tax=Sphingopyxis granuli TaxID=267128 RepID=UPI001F53B5EC|nr:DUF1963 domain-containing protein [Sphingopyxis granuli]UNK79424.1 DUF1963 domain-containing protein [Sphingopyxis granuli]
MSELQSAALTLAGVTLLFLAVLFLVMRARRPQTEPAPRAPAPRERPFAKRGRTRDDEPAIAMAPSRLARIKSTHAAEADDESAPPDHFDAAALEAQIAAVEQRATDAPAAPPETPIADTSDEAALAAAGVVVRLVPQVPLRDAISTNSRIGGRPRLPASLDWSRIDGVDAVFVAQIACDALPAALWDGLGPRHGSLAFFRHPATNAPLVLHLAEDGPPRDPPHGEPFPEWPVDVIEAAPGEPESEATDAPEDWVAALGAEGYDIADPAFHPFDWQSMLAMADLLEARLDRLATDAILPVGASEELTDAVRTNRDARARAEEIIAIIRDTAGRQNFSAADAGAVMAALHAIRWTHVTRETDPETGEERADAVTLPLTRHNARADLWVGAYLRQAFEQAQRGWCRDPGLLSAPARAFFEPLWRNLAERAAPTIGGGDPGREPGMLRLLTLPANGLLPGLAGGGADLVLSVASAEFAVGDVSRVRAGRRVPETMRD